MSKAPAMPHDLELERQVLASILLDPRCLDVVADVLLSEDFYGQRNKTVWEALCQLHSRSEPFDLVTLRHHLERSQKLSQAGGEEYVLGLTSALPNAENAEHYAKRIVDLARTRRMITACSKAAANGYHVAGDVQEYLDTCESEVFAASQERQIGSKYEPIRDIIWRRFKRLADARDKQEHITGQLTKFNDLDYKTGGLWPGNLVILAGRPGMGKTGFATALAGSTCKGGGSAAIFSMEMDKEELSDRFLASESRVSLKRVRESRMNEDDWQRVTDASAEVSSWNMFIDDQPALKLSQIRSRSRRIQAEHGLDIVLIDYLQLAKGDGRIESRHEEVASVSRGLKALAKELQVPVVALSQLNRGLEARKSDDKRPTLGDLRESGQLEQDADLILFLYRDEVYNVTTPQNRGIAELIVAKQRNGATGTVRLRWFDEIVRFANLDTHHPEPDDDAAAYQEH